MIFRGESGSPEALSRHPMIRTKHANMVVVKIFDLGMGPSSCAWFPYSPEIMPPRKRSPGSVDGIADGQPLGRHLVQRRVPALECGDRSPPGLDGFNARWLDCGAKYRHEQMCVEIWS